MLSTVTGKGQVTLPKKFREYLGVKPGSSVDFSLGPRGEAFVRATDTKQSASNEGVFSHLRGTLQAGYDTNAIMSHLRDYDADAVDPGFK